MNFKGFCALTGISAAAGCAATIYSQKQLKKPANKRKLWDTGNDAINGLIKGLTDIAPDVPRKEILDFDNSFFLDGQNVLLDEPAADAVWSLGFAEHSIVPDDLDTHNYYLGGYLAYPPNVATGVLDDLRVRSICLDDGSGRGALAFAVIDCVGISNHDIRDIRSLVIDMLGGDKLKGMDIGAIHCHSGIDTQGLWGDLKGGLLHNPVNILKKDNDAVISGRDPLFMQQLKQTAAETIINAYNNMTKGKLYTATADGTGFNHSKRPPYITDKRMFSVKFIPDDGSKPTVGVFFSSHPTNFGDKNKVLSADFPYYLCDELNKKGYNGIYFQGAELAVAGDRGSFAPPDSSRETEIECYGRAIADKVLEESNIYTQALPLLNFRNHELYLPCDNRLYLLLAKLGLIDNNMVKTGKKEYRFVTESGIVEIGKDVSLLLIPGELAPEVVMGGTLPPTEAYTHTEWSLPPLVDIVDSEVIPVGLCNDAIGYMVEDNDYGSIIAPLHYEEAVSAGARTASNIAASFIRIENEIRRMKKDHAQSVSAEKSMKTEEAK